MSTAGFGAMASAQAAVVNIPAPPSAANAVAVKVGNLVSVGQSGATAGASGATASAAPISIGGTPLLAGTKTTTKSGSGAAFDTGNTSIGRLAVAPWSTVVGSNSASSSSALAFAGLNGVGDVSVAPSGSFASWTPGQSYSSAVSDGAVIHLGQYTIKVLHSESDSSGVGHTYLVQLLGHNIAATDSNGCLVDVGPLAKVGCLSALRGVGSDAEVGEALIGTEAPFGKLIAAAATGGAAHLQSLPTAVNASDLSRSVSGSSNMLARTGAATLLLVAMGLLLIAAGMTARFGSKQFAVLPSMSRR